MKLEHLLVGIVWVIFSFFAYLLDAKSFALTKYSALQSLVFGVLILYFLYALRSKVKQVGFFELFWYAYLFLLVSSFLHVLTLFFLFKIIDPSLIDYELVQEHQARIAELKHLNAVPNVDLEELRDKVKARYSIGSLSVSFLLKCIYSIFISVILAVIFRKERGDY